MKRLKHITAVANEILGKPWKLGARGPDSFDCLGLMYFLFRECLGIVPPDPWASPHHYGDPMAMVEDFATYFHKLDSLGDLTAFDVLHIGHGSSWQHHHIAIVEDDKYVIHIFHRGNAGVLRSPLRQFLAFGVTAHRLKDLME